MYNPDQRYQAHILHLKDLYEQAEHDRMITALSRHQHAGTRTAARRLSVLLARLSAWLVRSAQRDERPAGCVALCQSDSC